MAASIVAAVPVTVIFVFLQRYFIQGLTAGAGEGIKIQDSPTGNTR